jgi:hypothetical protein
VQAMFRGILPELEGTASIGTLARRAAIARLQTMQPFGWSCRESGAILVQEFQATVDVVGCLLRALIVAPLLC